MFGWRDVLWCSVGRLTPTRLIGSLYYTIYININNKRRLESGERKIWRERARVIECEKRVGGWNIFEIF